MGKCKASQEHAFPPQVREGVEGLENDYVSAEKLKEINGEIGFFSNAFWCKKV